VAEEPTAHGDGPPPPTEEIHLPGPSYLPVLVAVGVTLVLVGLVLTPVVLAIGAVIAVVSVVIWIRQTREDIAELPLEH
jgi:hypothetical protein